MNLNTLKTGIVMGMMAFLFTLNANAQSQEKKQQGDKPPTIKELFAEMDMDEDGKLSKEEVKGPLKNDFTKIDTDNDGFLSEEELKKAPKPERQGRPQGPPNRN